MARQDRKSNVVDMDELLDSIYRHQQEQAEDRFSYEMRRQACMANHPAGRKLRREGKL